MSAELFPERPMERTAVLSPDGRYRYRLGRRWADGPTLGWIMLNPSTADADVNDPTIRRCIGFARREGCGAIDVANLFAWRATEPDALLGLNPMEAAGPDNYAHLVDVLANCERIVAAWGGWLSGPNPGLRDRSRMRPSPVAVEMVADTIGVELLCLGRTSKFAPRHPLYVRGDQPLEPFTREL